MKDLILLIYLMTSLYASGMDASEPVFTQKIAQEIQINGIEATVDRLESDLPALLAEAGVKLPASLDEAETEQPPDLAGTADSATSGSAINEPAKIDYQKELKALGYYKDETSDSRLNLRNAVLRFQSSCNLTVDGIWGNQSNRALASILRGDNLKWEDIIENSPSEGKWLAINKTRRILTLYEDKQVLKKYPVAIGNPPSLTPDGKYTIVSKVINPAWGGGGYAKPVKGGIPENPLGYRWLGLSYKSGSDLGVHGNNSPYSIGKNISHGCIRMINSDVEQLFEIVPRSAPVWIGTDSQLRAWGLVQNSY